MMDLLPRHQRATLLKQGDDRGIGLENEEPVVLRQSVAYVSTSVHVAQLAQTIAGAGGKVIDTVRGRGVHGSGSLVLTCGKRMLNAEYFVI